MPSEIELFGTEECTNLVRLCGEERTARWFLFSCTRYRALHGKLSVTVCGDSPSGSNNVQSSFQDSMIGRISPFCVRNLSFTLAHKIRNLKLTI